MTAIARQRRRGSFTDLVYTQPLWALALSALIAATVFVVLSIPEYGTGLVAAGISYVILERLSRLILMTSEARVRARRYLPFSLLAPFLGYWLTWSGGGTDSVLYHASGEQIFEQVRNGEPLELRGIPGTGTVEWITGMTYLGFGRDNMIAHVLFASVSIIGRMMLAPAISLWFPVIREKVVVTFVMLLPSAWFWTSLQGKEPWIALGLGMVMLGGARLTHGYRNAVILVGLGLLPLMMIRPHFGAAVAPALLVSLLVRSKQENYERRTARKSVFIRIVLPSVCVAFALFALGSAAQHRGVTGGIGLDSLESSLELTRDTQFGGTGGGSNVQAPNTATPVGFIEGLLMVYFRPFLWEAGSAPMLVSGAEALLTGGIVLWGMPTVIRRYGRRMLLTPGGLFVLVNLVTGVLIIGSFGNLGLMVRQRMQLLGVLAVLVLLPIEIRRAEKQSRLLAGTVRPEASTELTPL